MTITYNQFANQTVSEKIGLVILEAAERVLGWVVHSGSVYKITGFSRAVISTIEDSGVALNAGTSTTLSAGQYYHDRTNQILYLRTSDSVNPNGKFIGLTFKLFFSTPAGLVSLPNDLASGFEVEWFPLIQDTSDFGVDLDNSNQLGLAIEGSGSVKFINEREFWSPLYDKVYFENQKVLVYSWTRGLAASQAKILFRGKIQAKTYSDKNISFTLKDAQNSLRAVIPLNDMSTYGGARLTGTLATAKQRRVYGYVYGHRPTNIDAILDGYPLVGTVDVTNGSATITGTGTEFLRQVSPDDELLFVSPVATVRYTVNSVDSDTQVTLNSVYGAVTRTGTGVYIRPKNPKRYINRRFLIAGHALKEPVPTVSAALPGVNRIELTSVADLIAGEPLIVGSETTTIERIVGNQVKLSLNLLTPPTVGTVVKRPAVTNVILNGHTLNRTRDYTYDPATALLTLTATAEFNVAQVVSVSGTVSFTSASRTVTGSGTNFKSEFKAGDWVRTIGQSDYFEILGIVSDTELTLRTPATYTVFAGAAKAKKPEYYIEDKTILTCDVLGATDDGTSTGVFLKTAPQISENLLILGQLTDTMDHASFTAAAELAYQKIGLAIPTRFNDKNVPKLKDVLNQLNKSVFGSVIQNNEFKLIYHVLRPVREQGITRFSESDILKFTLKSLSDKISATARIRYLNLEYDHLSGAAIFSQTVSTSKIGTYLAKTGNETLVETLLVDPVQATQVANRWAFILGAASTVLTLTTKMQGALLNVTDRLEVSHEHLFQRVGTTATTKKIGGIQSVKRSFNDSTIEIEDLSNAFSRCAVIQPNGLASYANSSEDQKFYGSFITDDFGMQDNDPATYGINLIW